MSIAADLVVLHGGPAVPLAALQVIWDLEERGFSLRRDGDCLVVTPGSRLTGEDKAVISRHRQAVLAVLTYLEANVQ